MTLHQLGYIIFFYLIISSADYTALVFDKLVDLGEIIGKSLIICFILIANVGDNSLAFFILPLIKVKDRVFFKDKVRQNGQNEHATRIQPNEPLPTLQKLINSSNNQIGNSCTKSIRDYDMKSQPTVTAS